MDDASFTAFVDARYPMLLRTATLLTGSRPGGEDLLQEALIRTFLAWRTVRASAAAEAYVRTTMVRLLLRDRRRRWSGEIPSGDLPESAVSDPDVATAESVRAALRTLPSDQRAALVLRHWLDLSEGEAASTLGCPPGTVKSRVSRGLAALRASGLLAEETSAPERLP